MSLPVSARATRVRGIFDIALNGETAGSETWSVARDGVVLKVASTIVMRRPEPSRQELSFACDPAGGFLKLEVALQLGAGLRRASVVRQGDRLEARVFEENAPSYENAFSAAGFEKVDFGSVLCALPVLVSGRLEASGACELSALLLPLPDLRPIEVRELFRDEGLESLVLAGGPPVRARRLSQVTVLPSVGEAVATLWADLEGLPVRQRIEHGSRRLDVTLVSREEGPRASELPVLHGR